MMVIRSKHTHSGSIIRLFNFYYTNIVRDTQDIYSSLCAYPCPHTCFYCEQNDPHGNTRTIISYPVEVLFFLPCPRSGAGFYIATVSASSSSSSSSSSSPFCQHTNISETLCPMMLIVGHNNKSVNAHF